MKDFFETSPGPGKMIRLLIPENFEKGRTKDTILF
jgi:hypothetical protein